jgi:hypothetical protein
MGDERIRLRLGGSETPIDLESLQEACVRVRQASEKVRYAAHRCAYTHEEREAAIATHRSAVDDLVAARPALEMAQADLRDVETGKTIPSGLVSHDPAEPTD